MAYTDIDNPLDYFNTVLYTGNNTSQSITGVGFKPDWVWCKSRNDGNNHNVFDSVRGVTKWIETDNQNAEQTASNTLTSFNSDGFSVGDHGEINGGNDTQVSWCWLTGTSFTNDASGTSIGSIDSAGSASDASGFSIVSYTGTGSAGTIKHGLSSAPKMIIAKDRASGSLSWFVGHASLGFTKRLKLDGNNDAADNTVWNNTNPTSSVFSVGSSANANTSGNAIIAYCFAEKQGYSKFNKFVGNGNVNGSYIHLGFSPAFVMVKNTSAAENWIIFDNKRPGRNLTDALLKPNLNNVESTSGVKFDLLSNGFKARVSDAEGNSSGHKFIYMAFASNPFVTSTGVPATAR